MGSYFNLVNNLNNYANYYFIIIIVSEKPLWGGSIKYVCMYVYASAAEKLNQGLRATNSTSGQDVP